MELTKEDLHELLGQVSRIAREAGAYLMGEQSRLRAGDVETKGYHDYVSYVDRESERRIVHGLQQLLPEAGFLAEEETRAESNSGMRWIIDPLDGTTNYIHHLPLFSVSIALEKDGNLLLGVVYEPNQDECFAAARDIPSTLNGSPIKTSDTRELEESLLATGFPYADHSRLENYIGFLRYCMRTSRGIRRFGSAAVDLAYVACGRFDAFFEYGLQPWDVAAGSLIVQNAGGVVCDFKGKQDYLYGLEIIASNGHLNPIMQQKLTDHFAVSV